jgi:hypothetical protein
VAIDTKNVLDDKIDKLVLKHGLCMEVGDEERDVVPLQRLLAPSIAVCGRIRRTATGFRRRIMKFSALIIMKRVNL